MTPKELSPLIELDSGATIRGLPPGYQVLGRFTLVSILGRGGMGLVWKAFDERLKREVAIKVLPDVLRHDVTALEDLKRETLRSQELAHDNIVWVYDFVEDQQCAGITMEFINGYTLATLRTQQPNQVFEAQNEDFRKWLGQLGEALNYAHRKLVHRDLKPTNLMVNQHGNLKITDFGISCSVSESMTRVSAGQFVRGGTLSYMSPQQALGRPPTVLDDVYSTGATLYELLTSKAPFYAGDLGRQLEIVVPPSIEERRKELGIKGRRVPQRWEEAIAASLAKAPEKRPQSVRELISSMLGAKSHRKTREARKDDSKSESEGEIDTDKKLALEVGATPEY